MTKYARQIASARKTIVRKGMYVAWYKPGVTDAGDLTPEYPDIGPATEYLDIPIVLYPAKRPSQATLFIDTATMTGVEQLFGIIPGDVPFAPEINDAVLIAPGNLVHVAYINTTQPDGTPIVHEIGFK